MQDARWLMDFHIVLRRLEVLATAVPPPEPAPLSSGETRARTSKRAAVQIEAQSERIVRRRTGASSSTAAPESDEVEHRGLKDIVVVNSRSAKRQQGWTKKFQKEYRDKGYEVSGTIFCIAATQS